MLDTLSSLAAGGILVLSAYAVGRPISNWLKIPPADLPSHFAWALACGYVSISLLWTLLGLAGWLYAFLVTGATFLAAGIGLWLLFDRFGPQTRENRQAHSLRSQATSQSKLTADSFNCPDVPRRVLQGLIGLAIVASAGSLIGALAPCTDGDALAYHLELPKVYLQQHAIVHQPFNDYATFPLLVEMCYLWALALDGPVAAQLVHWTFGLLLALATVDLASPLVGRSWAWCAAGLVLLTPGITNQMTAPLNDAGLALFVTLALAAGQRALSRPGEMRWWIAAGIMLGAALGTKYVGMLILPGMAVVWCVQVIREPSLRGQLGRGALLTTILAVSIAGPWYFRAAWHRGNPVYPFFAQQFGSNAPNALPERKTPLQWRPVDLAVAPWQVTMHPERFGGRGHQLGAMFLLLLPGLLLVARPSRMLPLASVALVYLLAWYELRQNVRFLHALVPIFATLAGCGLAELYRLPSCTRRLAGSLLAANCLFGALVPWLRSYDNLPVVTGWEARGDYLARKEPSYRMAIAANRLLQPGDAILSQDYRGYYFDAPFVRESVFHRLSGYARTLQQPDELGQVLRNAGFTYVLLAEAKGPGIRFNQRLGRILPKSQPVLTTTHQDTDGTRRSYRLVRLP